MPNFTGASRNRTSKPQTTRSDARKSSDVGMRGSNPAHIAGTNTNGNRGFLGGSNRPEGSRR